MVKLPHVSHARPEPVTFDFHDLLQVPQIVKGPLVDHLFGSNLSNRLMVPLALQLGGLQRPQPAHIGAALAYEVPKGPQGVFPIIPQVPRALFLVEEFEHGSVPTHCMNSLTKLISKLTA